jgi:hypothetical protein
VRMGLSVPRTFAERGQRRLLQVALRRKPAYDMRRQSALDSASVARA